MLAEPAYLQLAASLHRRLAVSRLSSSTSQTSFARRTSLLVGDQAEDPPEAQSVCWCPRTRFTVVVLPRRMAASSPERRDDRIGSIGSASRAGAAIAAAVAHGFPTSLCRCLMVNAPEGQVGCCDCYRRCPAPWSLEHALFDPPTSRYVNLASTAGFGII